MLGVLGGMGPAATADFLAKLVALTPAGRDQEHIPVLVSCRPRIPDRSTAILGGGPSPLPALLERLDQLVAWGAEAVAIPCNSSHHWYERLQADCPVPILHIADAALAALSGPAPGAGPVAVLATRGTLRSGFYQRKLALAGHARLRPDEALQVQVDAVIAAVKAADPARAGAGLARVWEGLALAGAGAALLACTELPLAAAHLPAPPYPVVDTTLELARAAVSYALAAGWNRTPPES
jgi:aspartate racemase